MNIITVSQINKYIKALLEESIPLKNLYISGEISNYKYYYSSGHIYFTLKDEKSQLKAVMFSSNASRLKFTPENGMKVICSGRISVYEKNGEYQLYCDDMQPDGIGALNLAYEQLKDKLSKEGLFDNELKKTIPQYPNKIGVATSDIGAAVEDIKNITKRRYPLAQIVIVPTIVQGDNAPQDIVKSIKLLDNMGDIDVIIVGRGGGSIEDLWAFNTEIVARAIFECKTPIISAVGHETDFTISDFVSDMRAPTPSAAAELVCPDINVLINNCLSLNAKLKSSIINIIENEECYVDKLTSSPVIENFESVITNYKEKSDALHEELCENFEYYINNNKLKLSAVISKLDALSPLAVLARGYTVALKDNKIVKSINQINNNETIMLVFQNGKARCKIEEVNND